MKTNSILKYNDFKMNESVVSNMLDIAEEYDEKNNTTFFREFIEVFPTEEEFSSNLREFYDDHNDDEELDDRDLDEKYWTPQMEISILKKIITAEYPGNKAWAEFYNDLLETEWNK